MSTKLRMQQKGSEECCLVSRGTNGLRGAFGRPNLRIWYLDCLPEGDARASCLTAGNAPSTLKRMLAHSLAAGVATLLFLSHALPLAAQLPAPDANDFPRLSLVIPTNAAAPRASNEVPERQANSYVIVANDVIWLKVYQEDDLETRAKVNKDGLVTMPLLGAVAVAGKSVDDAAEMIRKELDRRFIVNPQVSLTVVEYSKRKFTILGQVSRPGVYEYPGEEKLTVLQAVALAGGFTRLAAPGRVRIQRLERDHPTVHKVDAEEVAKDPGSTPFLIQPDDTITVGSRWF